MKSSFLYCYWISWLSRRSFAMTIKIHGYERKFYEFYIIQLHIWTHFDHEFLNLHLWFLYFWKPMNTSFLYCYWLAWLSRRSFAMTIKIQGYEEKSYDIRYPAVCLNPFSTKSSWVCAIDLSIFRKPMKNSFLYSYWLASQSRRIFAMTIKITCTKENTTLWCFYGNRVTPEGAPGAFSPNLDQYQSD